MQRRRRDDEHCIDLTVGEKVLEVAMQTLEAERVLRPGELFGDRAACGDKRDPRDAASEVLGVAAAEASESRDADAQARRGAHSSTIRFSRHDVVAASASSSAFT